MEPEAHELTPKEEAALDAWAAPAPAEGFRDRVLARLDREAVPTRRSRTALLGGLIAAGVVAAVLGATLTLRGNRGADAGSAAAVERTTARITRRAVAVLEVGSAVRWGRDGKGATRVEQASGNVFYRVEEGSAFYVVANEVSVRVTGTCFRVEVSEMKAKTAGALGTTIGAVASAVVFVTVYEGSVVTASPKGEAAVAAGQVAEVRAGEAPAVRLAAVASMAASAHAATQAVREEQAAGAAREARASAAAVATLTERERQWKAQAEKLEHEVETLRAAAARGGKAGANEFANRRPHEMTQEDLLRAAKECRLIWEYPHMHPTDAPKFSSKKAQAAGLIESEIDLANDVLKVTSRKLFETTRDLYRELTGDEVVGSLSAEAMQSEMWDKTPQDERARVFQRLAREKAGLEKPPATLAGTTPFERGMRLMTGVADALERDIGAKIGPDLARKLREGRGAGWGSRSNSSSGCPKGSETR